MTFDRLNLEKYRHCIHHDMIVFLPVERQNKVILNAIPNCPKMIYLVSIKKSDAGKEMLLNLLPKIEEMQIGATEDQKKNIDLFLYFLFKCFSANKISWDECYDYLITTFNGIDDKVYRREQSSYDYDYIFDYLPKERSETVLTRVLQEPTSTAIRALRVIHKCPTDKTMTAFFNRVAKAPKAFVNDKDINYACSWVDHGGGRELILQKIIEAWKTHNNSDFYEFLEVNFGGSYSIDEICKVDSAQKNSELKRVQNMLAEFSQKHNGQLASEKVFLLETSEEKNKNNVIAGYPIGMNAETHPKQQGKYLTFLFHLSFESFPELKDRYDANHVGVNVFMDTWNDMGEASLFPIESTALNPGGYDYEPIQQPTFFDALPVSVPSAAFIDPNGDLEEADEELLESIEEEVVESLGNIRSAINQLSGYVLGKPIWLQEANRWDDGFIMQFDESFVPVNLGDMGIMYVFNDGGSWQCN